MGELRPLLHPYVRFEDGATGLRGRSNVLRRLADHPTPRPPTAVEVRDGQVYRWFFFFFFKKKTRRSTQTERWSEEGNGKSPVRR